MQFLSDLSTVQRAGGAAVLVLLLVLLLVKQRQAKGAPAGKASAPKAERPSRMSRAPREKAGKAKAFSRGKKGKEGADDPDADRRAQVDVRAHGAAAAGGGGRWGARRILAGPHSSTRSRSRWRRLPRREATDGMISEPGWPTPGEVWASPDSVNGYGAGEESWEGVDQRRRRARRPACRAHRDSRDGLRRLGHGQPRGGLRPRERLVGDGRGRGRPPTKTCPAWEKEQAEFDWTATDADSEWGAPDADEATDEISSAQAAWEAPEDDTATWSAEDLWEMPKEEPAEEVAPVATAVAEEPFAVAEWTMPETTVEPVSADEPAATSRSARSRRPPRSSTPPPSCGTRSTRLRRSSPTPAPLRSRRSLRSPWPSPSRSSRRSSRGGC